ncbi:MAG: response regulator [Deltaproteobacteria bacterium]|nr:MAG: response regulator [Deltaproteobacteria bacterium]
MDLFSKLKDIKILLVDDDEWIRGSMTLSFRSKGCHLLALETAEDGLEAIKRQRYDIIICDYRLPGMDGLKFLKLVTKSRPDTMKVLMTAYANIEVAAEAIKIGVHDFIQKPISAKTIEASLTRLIEKHEKSLCALRQWQKDDRD